MKDLIASIPRLKADIIVEDAPELQSIILLKRGYKLGADTYHITGAGKALVMGKNNYLIKGVI